MARKIFILIFVFLIVAPFANALIFRVADSYFYDKGIEPFPSEDKHIIPTPVDLECFGNFRLIDSDYYRLERGDTIRAKFYIVDEQNEEIYESSDYFDCDISRGLNDILCYGKFENAVLPRSEPAKESRVRCRADLYLGLGKLNFKITRKSNIVSEDTLTVATDVYYFMKFDGANLDYTNIPYYLSKFYRDSGYSDSGRIMRNVLFEKNYRPSKLRCPLNVLAPQDCLLDNIESYFDDSGIKVPDDLPYRKVDKVIGFIPACIDLGNGNSVCGAARVSDESMYMYSIPFIQQIAHELGHLYGLGHPGERRPYDSRESLKSGYPIGSFNRRDSCCDNSGIYGSENCLESAAGSFCSSFAGQKGSEKKDDYCLGERCNGNLHCYDNVVGWVASPNGLPPLVYEGCISDYWNSEYSFESDGPNKLVDLFRKIDYKEK